MEGGKIEPKMIGDKEKKEPNDELGSAELMSIYSTNYQKLIKTKQKSTRH